MIAVRVMQVVGDAIVDVIAMRHRLVTAAGAVDVAGRMPIAAMVHSAAVGVAGGDFDHMLVDMIAMRVVEMAVMQVVDMPPVAHRRVAAARSVLMGMAGVVGSGTGSHRAWSFPCPEAADTAVRLSAAWSIALVTSGSTCSSASA